MIIIDETIVVIEKEDLRLMRTLAEGKGFLGIDFSKSGFLKPVLDLFGKLKTGVTSFFGKLFRGKKTDTTATQSDFTRASEDAYEKMEAALKKYEAGTATYTRTADDLRGTVEHLHRLSFAIGVAAGEKVSVTPGVKVRLSADQLKWVEEEIRQEMAHLEKLLGEMRQAKAGGGKLLTRFAKRLRAYANAKHVYYAGRIFGAPEGTVVDWISPLDRLTCASCRFLATYSPFTRETLPTTPKAGDTLCRHNCRCRLVVRQVTPDEYKAVVARQKARAWYAQMLEAIMTKKALGRTLTRGSKSW